MDSTIRSNLSVGMSLDLAIVRRDALKSRCIEASIIRDGWSESLRNAFHALPDLQIP